MKGIKGPLVAAGLSIATAMTPQSADAIIMDMGPNGVCLLSGSLSNAYDCKPALARVDNRKAEQILHSTLKEVAACEGVAVEPPEPTSFPIHETAVTAPSAEAQACIRDAVERTNAMTTALMLCIVSAQTALGGNPEDLVLKADCMRPPEKY
ncbi:hypothetical protein JKY72_03495 [Candidatus Gracilibacteria bacterium]|nr:hypothetical protein [Candidatus Gracilibacteria bacterium]